MRYRILKDFKGSQTGSTAEDFKAGTEAELSDYLASCVDPAWIQHIDAAGAADPQQTAASPATTSRRKKSAPHSQGEQA